MNVAAVSIKSHHIATVMRTTFRQTIDDIFPDRHGRNVFNFGKSSNGVAEKIDRALRNLILSLDRVMVKDFAKTIRDPR